MGEQEEIVRVLKLSSGDSVSTLKELKQYIGEAKDALNELEIGSEEYNETLRNLQTANDALRDSMNMGVKTIVAQTGSYNDLVHTMRELKQQWRATTDEAERARIGVKINDINNQLKELDASVGNFSRNVGDYRNQIVLAGQALGGKLGGAIGKVDKSMKLLSANPVMGVVTLLLPLVMKITDALKDNEKAVSAVNKATEALQPVFNALEKVLDIIADTVGKVVDYLVEMAGESSDTFKTIVSGAVGVGNALLQFLLTPIRTIIEAAKGLGNVFKDIFTGQFSKIKEDAGTALGGIKDAFAKGFDFKSNFAAGKEAGEAFIAGLGSTKSKAKKTAGEMGREIGKELVTDLTDEIDKELQALTDTLLKNMEEANKKARQRLENRLADIEKAAKTEMEWNNILTQNDEERQEKAYEITKKGLERRINAMEEALAEAEGRGDLDAVLELETQISDAKIDLALATAAEQERIRKEDLKREQDAQKQKMATFQAYASGLSSLCSSIADAYEGMSEDEEKAAEETKALRIAAAVIDMIAGAVTAYSSAQSLGPIAGPIVGAINAAAVTAAGLANIAKIRSTKVDRKSAPSSGSGAVVSAPPVVQQVPVTRSVTSASEEERLDKMASDKRVVLVYDDVEQAGKYVDVVQDESEF